MNGVIFFGIFIAAFAVAAYFLSKQVFEDGNAALDIAYRRELELQAAGVTTSRWQKVFWILREFIVSLSGYGKVYLGDQKKERPVSFTIDL